MIIKNKKCKICGKELIKSRVFRNGFRKCNCSKLYSKCIRCIKNEWCKAYDKTDLSLNNCTDFIDYFDNIDKVNFSKTFDKYFK